MNDLDEERDCDNITFYELIQDEKIHIPMIQRDYAQGREANLNLLIDFLNTIKQSLENNRSLNLDFVYGNKENGIFNPLDGQQRLTTLFLLHWYAYEKEKSDDLEVQSTLSRFSYETRLSSRRFCEALVRHVVPLREEERLSKVVTDEQWFFLSWGNDPTIKAMLNAIDVIHLLFFKVDQLWEKLVDRKLITFHLLILKDFGLSDDLYIKMNARGKLLTPFENLKAKLQDKAQKNKWEERKVWDQTFAKKIDCEWTDFLWGSYRKNNSVDEQHMNFITTLVMFRVALGSTYMGAERDDIVRRLNENNSDRNLIDYIDKECFEYIYRCYELYSTAASKKIIPKLKLELWRHQPERDILYQILDGARTSYTQKILFFAQTQYMLKNETVDEEKFNDWMRVVRNIVSRGDVAADGKRPDIVRRPESFYGCIKLINELSNGCGDIYNYLNSHSVISTFAKEQVKEEIIKAKIIIEDPIHKKLLFDTEDNELLRGQIMFLLKCAGYKKDIKEIDFAVLEDVKDVFHKYFNKDLENQRDFIEFDLLRRSLLTIEYKGEYRFYNYWESYWYAGHAEKRKLLPRFREIEYIILSNEYSIYFKKLINLLIDKDYQEIIDEFEKPKEMENWQYRLIKEPDLLKNCSSKYIAIPSDRSCCYLLKNTRPSEVEGNMKVE